MPIRQPRDLTRTRSAMVHDRTKVYQRIEKFLKSSRGASTLTGVLASHMLDTLVAGKRDSKVLANKAQRRMRPKIPDLIDAIDV